MIILLSTCSEKLSEEEFVSPVARIVGGCKILHYKEKLDFKKNDKLIICGTALKDNDYLENLKRFNYLKDIEIPVLGICSGMQILCMINGSALSKKTEIGLIDIRTTKPNKLFDGNFKAYSLHQNSVTLPKGFITIAKSRSIIQSVKHKEKEIYGVMFHPEVRNREMIEKFLTL